MIAFRKTILAFVCMLFLLPAGLRADEGMWIPMLLKSLNEADMQAKGLKLTAEDIYSVNHSSLKDAIALFGGGCTSELISGSGLLLTNHHCGYGRIQYHSSVENDYLTDGFWARSLEEELANPGLTVTFLVRMEDVTEKVLKGVTAEMDPAERDQIISANIQVIESETEAGSGGLDADIRAFFYGNEYYMLVSKTYNDIRLVGAPPSSIGKFGGDTDNWMWPRHTGDFSLFRIYAGPDNEPADYSEENVPFKPIHSLPVSLKGVEEGDFTMVFGYPGRTQQYLTSYAVQYVTEVSNPVRIHMREVALGLMMDDMVKSDKVRIQYAAKYAGISNYHKKWIGESRGLIRLDALDKKKALEADFTQKLKADPALQQKYGELLPRFKELYANIEKYALARDCINELFYYGGEYLRFANGYTAVANSFETLEEEGKLDETASDLKSSAERFFKDYNAPTDHKVFASVMKLFQESVDPGFLPQEYLDMRADFGGDMDKLADHIFETSVFVTPDRLMPLFDKFDKKAIKKIRKDPAFVLATAMIQSYRENIYPGYEKEAAEIELLMSRYVAGIMEVFPDKTYWPDANSTLRLTYGKVEGYEPADGVEYGHYTTLDGVMEKYVPGDREFDLPEKLLDIYERKDFGQYANDQGQVPVCFVASNHTTGGNSGSPVIDGEGNLIGLNFDRSWESTMSDIMFDPERCRNISVDARYILFIIDKFAGATRLIEEMKLVKPEPVGLD